MMTNTSAEKIVRLEGTKELYLVEVVQDPTKYIEHKDPVELIPSIFLLGTDGKVTNDGDFIFYNNPRHASDSSWVVFHDYIQSFRDCDVEQIAIDLSRVPSYISSIAVTVTIYDSQRRKQNFGQTSNAYVRVVKVNNEHDNGIELSRCELTKEFADKTAVLSHELLRNGNEWIVSKLGMGYNGGLEDFCRKFGVDID